MLGTACVARFGAAGSMDVMSRRIEIRLERVDRDRDRRVGVGAPQFPAGKHHGVEPLRIIAAIDRDRVWICLAAVANLDRAHSAAGGCG